MKYSLIWLMAIGILLPNIETDLYGKDKKKKGVPPGLQKKGGVPPGLRKKGGLPPGHAKKRGWKGHGIKIHDVIEIKVQPKTHSHVEVKPVVIEHSHESKPTVKSQPKHHDGPIIVHARTPKKVSREVQRRRVKLDYNVKALNHLGQDLVSREQIFKRLGKHTNIPMSIFDYQLQQHPELGAGDLFVANKIAKKSKTRIQTILAQHKAGASWGELIKQYNVNLPDFVKSTQETETAARRALQKSR